MDHNLEKKIEFKDKLLLFLKESKIKLLLVIGILILFSASIVLFQINSNQKKILISEKYIQAGIYLKTDKTKSRKILEEIILSKNKFYSPLALNLILEKNLISDNKKIIKYFQLLEEIKLPEDKSDLILLKKALYLIKISEEKDSNKILKNLIDKNSQYKSLAEDLIIK